MLEPTSLYYTRFGVFLASRCEDREIRLLEGSGRFWSILTDFNVSTDRSGARRKMNERQCSIPADSVRQGVYASGCSSVSKTLVNVRTNLERADNREFSTQSYYPHIPARTRTKHAHQYTQEARIYLALCAHVCPRVPGGDAIYQSHHFLGPKRRNFDFSYSDTRSCSWSGLCHPWIEYTCHNTHKDGLN
jgi:hypothetical protein